MKPTLTGYLELLWKALVATTVLIIMGVLCALAALFIPFMLSLICVLALVGAGAFAFSWTYVFAGAGILLLLFACAYNDIK